MADIFISYAREDRPLAERLARALEAEGRSVWWDREILAGHDFADVIAGELARARCVLVIWSPSSIGSHWVRDEAREGLERKALVPVLVGEVEPPLGFRSIHAARLGESLEGYEEVRGALAGLLEGRTTSVVPVRRSARRWRRWAPWGLALLALTALLAPLIVLDPFGWLAEPEEPPRPVLQPETFTHCEGCPEMVVLPPGRFEMGAAWLDREAQSDERPIVEVSLAQRFAIGRHEVTTANWQTCVQDGGCNGYVPDDNGWEGPNRPVIHVSWEDAQAYLAWLRRRTGQPYRLPSEAEWEYACRAGTHGRYPFGDAIAPSFANYDRQVGATRDVGSYPANAWGLYDMNGNVWEWVEDGWSDGHDGAAPDGSPRPLAAGVYDRVIRGGSWDDPARRVRCISRNRKDQDQRENEIGFRVALTLP